MCRQRGIYPNNAYVSNVLGTMKRMLFCLEWTERPSNELLPFEDGVLFIESSNFQEHAPGFRLTWSLPRQFRGSAVNINGWGSIASWLDEATEGSSRKKKILLAFAAASLRGMAKLQKFLMLTGPGGTGKGVFSQLLTMVLGERNTWIGNLEDLSKADRIAELQTKRLALFDDQEKYMGNLSNFRSLTGGGQISGRKLYKDPINFHFNGLALITANQPCFPASGISWLKRRIIQEEFRHHPSRPNVYLQKQLEPELSAFTQYLLSIPVAEIEGILSPESTGVNLTFWEDRIQADPLASWINDNIIHETGAFTAIGSDKDEWKEGDYDPTKSTLFGGYNLTCRQGNSIPLSKNKFSANLVELCQSVLGWRDVAKIRKGDARYIVGIRFRTAADSAILPLDQTLNDDERQHDVNLNDNLKPIQDMGCADLDDLLSKNLEKNTSTEELVQKMNFESESSTADLFIEKSGDSDANVSTSHTQQGNGSTLESSSTSSAGSSQSKLLLLQEYAQRIMEAIGFQSPAVGRAIAGDIQRSLVAKDISESELVELAGAETYQAFTTLRALTDNEVDLVEIVQKAIASNDVEIAKSVLSSLKEVCNSGAADRQKVWNSLAESERVAFKALVQ
jgi:putative DNA primase/helicase